MSRSRLDAAVRAKFELSWGKARSCIETGKVWLDGAPVTDEALLVGPEAVLELRMNTPRPGREKAGPAPVLARSQVVFVDSQLIVVNKPAGMSTVPFEKGEAGTLEQAVCAYLKTPKITIVHRLDRETSGLLAFARTPAAAKHLANQFRFHTVRRRYFALVQGLARSQTIRSAIVEDRGDGLRGSLKDGDGISRDVAKNAVTHVTALESFGGLTLVECVLETGRTHQIRIHLSEAGHPLLGEKAYIRDFAGARLEAPRLMLHAAELGFEHPGDRVPMRWTQLPPSDFLALMTPRARTLLAERLKRPAD